MVSVKMLQGQKIVKNNTGKVFCMTLIILRLGCSKLHISKRWSPNVKLVINCKEI